MLSLSIASPGTAVTFLRGNGSSNSTSSSFHGVRIPHQASARVPISSSSRKPLAVMMSKREAELKEIRAKTTEELNEESIVVRPPPSLKKLQEEEAAEEAAEAAKSA
ncbi:hypothetical protein BRARA_F02392 [Brassica rapa]|uniref:Uncharacterized protein n=1 Tax=Brassica campestris TaxID=3711 RepID=A0A397Z0P0_BRACM|nr:hypothetical protein BRARA_F02392 [Brassica rapa]